MTWLLEYVKEKMPRGLSDGLNQHVDLRDKRRTKQQQHLIV